MPRLEFIQEGSSAPFQGGEGLNLLPPLTREMQEVRGDAGEKVVHRHCPPLPPRKQDGLPGAGRARDALH